MNYIIAGKNDAAGISGNDSADLAVYFELGWEVVGSRLDAIKLLRTNKISNENTTIVTIDDRKFMYTSMFKNVISWDEFKKRNANAEIGMFDTVEDWTQTRQFSFLNPNNDFEFWENRDASPQTNSRYSRYEQDYDYIVNGFSKNNEILRNLQDNEQYFVACLRLRDHCNFRSSPKEWWLFLLNKITAETGKKVFLVGHGAEKFIINENMIHVPKLQDYVTLIQDDRCKAVIAQSTGTCGLAFSASKSPIHWIDHANVSFINENNAVMGGNCGIFTKSTIYRYGHDFMNEEGINIIFSRIQK